MMERYGYSIFCDDIRNEPGGKLSFIGCYNAVMFTASQFPLVLPKFCTHFHVFSPATKPYESILARCYVPGSTDPIAEEAIDLPSLHDQMDLLVSLPKNGAVPPCIVVAASLVFAPLEIPEPGMIQIRALINGGTDELHLGSLTVTPTRGDNAL
jgi:hypothetical protein